MTIEKINSTQPLQTTPVPKIHEENEKQEVQKTSGSSKDIVTALSLLAAIGAAGVAIYKHKNTKKLVEEAENKAKKKIEEAENSAKAKIEEAENKVKKAEEESEQKVKDAVEQLSAEYKKLIKEAENKQKKSVEDTTDKKQDDTKVVINTKLSDFYTKIKNSVKKLFKRTSKKEKTAAEIKPETEPQNNIKPGKKDSTVKKDNIFIRTWNKFLGLFKRKKTKTPVLEITKEGETAKQNIRRQLSGKTDYAKLANDLVKEPNTPAEHNRIQALYNTLAKEEPKSEDIFNGIKLPDVTKVAEQDLITEYNALSKIIKDLPVMDKTAQRFLQIQGELLNHRNYIMQPNGEIKKLVPEKINIIASKDLRETPELDLLVEYCFLKNRIKNLPVMDPDAQRFLQIRGELVNHRKFKVMPDGNIKKISVKKPSLKDRIRNFFRF